MLLRVIAYIVGSTVAVLAMGTVLGDDFVTYDDATAVLVFGVALGLLSTFIKPVLKLLTLPLTCLTFGLFSLVINTALFGLAAWISPGLDVTFWGAVIGAVVTSVTAGAIFSIVDEP
ncbi:MAG: phage holin family protein [Thermomicrobiales bacterium]